MARLRTTLFALLCLPALAFAQQAPTAAAIFGNGKPVQFRPQDMDRRFDRSLFARALSRGTADPACAQVITGMLAVLADAAPSLHRRDENFTADPGMVRALSTQLTTQRFPGTAYLAAMVRKVMLEKKLPPEWLKVALQLDPSGQKIDLARLKFLADGVDPIDSMYFTFSVLLQRYGIEVTRANSAAAPTALRDFRETYLDHDVAWGGMTLLDIKADKADDGVEGGMVAKLEIRPTDPDAGKAWAQFVHKKKPKPWRFTVHLRPTQYERLTEIPKGSRVLVRGRLYEFNASLTEFELRDGLLFLDHSGAAVSLASPAEVAQCPVAMDELHGVAPTQPGGFGMH
jgi:hypothetical protein